ncbi:lymphocyte antigen-6, epidermis [Oncorhynchus tshawytscha]|uniref:UPAR/Ly6 domain-containing protein n=1 Tax=Oncorhynchus tshawytscha TaxID=74940 RepID=A0A8C8M6G6_ONCTS|nr:lymphocyte antigen-6, epidermis [Oncorhynchus tshawytscha]
MNKLMWGCVALVGLFAVAESLKCNTCTVGLSSLCFIGSTAECSTDQPNCFTAEAVFNATSIVNLKRKGCLATAFCNTTSTGSILTAGYTVTQTCCSTDQCNGAVAIQLPLTVALGSALVAIWSTFT